MRSTSPSMPQQRQPAGDRRPARVAVLGALASIIASLATIAAPIGHAHAAAIGEIFAVAAPGSGKTVDHSAFSRLLSTYVKPSPDGINRVDYARWKRQDHPPLKAYVAALEAVDPTTLDRPEQFAYWANLYNAKTLDVVLDAYPVKSIKDINLGGSLLTLVTGGPWKAKVVKVKGEALSLDDIEHVIMRPLFKDPRVHYSVNCASIGCPNLMTEAFTGATLEAQLDASARAFVNHPRGIRIADGRVTASSIYSWFQVDFGAGPADVLDHARKYASPELKAKLTGVTTIAGYDYDWRLNEVSK